MDREPKVVIDGWSEVKSNLEKTGFFKDDELSPHMVPRILAKLVIKYTTIVGSIAEGEPTPIGSGSLLRRRDGQCGILTAGHVIGAIEGKKISILPYQGLEKSDWVRIEGMGMRVFGEKNNKQTGPDIGWMPLSAEEETTMEARGVVFRNRAKEEEIVGQVCQISIIVGFVKAASDMADHAVMVHALLTGETKGCARDEGGWDYGEYAITSDDEWIPRTHGGMSGSGVWNIDLPIDGKGRKNVRLVGVVYYQGPKDDRKLIAHGKESVKMILNETRLSP